MQQEVMAFGYVGTVISTAAVVSTFRNKYSVVERTAINTIVTTQSKFQSNINERSHIIFTPLS